MSERDVPSTSTRRVGTTKNRKGRLGVAEHALLGLIALAEDAADAGQGVHGYDLGRRFHDGPLADIIRLEPGMLYHYLKKLANAGYITTSVEHQTARPDRQDHRLTDLGTRNLYAWLDAPVRATRDVRLDFLVKLSFARQLDARRAIALVQEQRSVIAELLASLVGQRAALTDAGTDDDTRRTVLELRMAQTGAVLQWLSELPEAAGLP